MNKNDKKLTAGRCRTFYPPHQVDLTSPERIRIFLAGTIDMGNSVDWRQTVMETFTDYNVDLYNPRRKDWDSLWTETFENPQFYQQVTWELNSIDKCDLILMYFLPDSQSPITLLELGLYANSGRLVVVCPDEYYRSGNVHITCDRYGIPVYKNIDNFLQTYIYS